jgi:hypothetical protein
MNFDSGSRLSSRPVSGEPRPPLTVRQKRELRSMLANLTATAMVYGQNDTKQNYAYMVRSRAIAYGTILLMIGG